MNEIIFPEAFAERMKLQLQEEWPAFQAAHNLPLPVSIRLNPDKTPEYKVDGQCVPWTKYGFHLQERPVFTLDPAFHAGAYYVQEASSMFLEQVFMQCTDLTGNIRVLDLCAAPGGKSTHLSGLLNKESLLVSNEVIRSRAAILAENVQKWGKPNVVVTNNDASDFQSFEGFFDVIVLDAPCSGEGMFRKDPQAMQEWSPENVMLCAGRQKRILTDIWPSLKENGILVYCTCTYNECENEENLRWLQQHDNVAFMKLQVDPSWGIQTVEQGNVTGYRFYPHRAAGEGFFCSVIRKCSPSVQVNVKVQKNFFSTPGKKVLDNLRPWLLSPEKNLFIQRNDLIQSIPAALVDEVVLLLKHLRVVYAGLFIAEVKHDKLIPEHTLALSTEINRDNFPVLSCTREEALTFLRKETLTLPGYEKGFSLISFQHHLLGWVNVLPNRINNLYPAAWRIRMQ